jgi:hypothetical protein
MNNQNSIDSLSAFYERQALEILKRESSSFARRSSGSSDAFARAAILTGVSHLIESRDAKQARASVTLPRARKGRHPPPGWHTPLRDEVSRRGPITCTC